MKIRTDQTGSMNILLVPLILSVVFLFGALGFGAWAFIERQDYKDNSDEKAAAASAVAVERAKTEKDNEFLQREKEPLKSYTSPAQYGGFTIKYPKTWSVYANEQQEQITLLFQSDVVSANPKTAYALKVEVLTTEYSQSVKSLDGNIRQGKLATTSFALAKVPTVVGLRGDGQIASDKTGAVVYLPLRDKTLKISAEAPDKVADFNNTILPNFEFNP